MKSLDNFSDEEVVEKTRTEDPELYSVIIKRYQNRLLRYVNGLIKNNDLSIDIVQETLIKSYVNLRGFDTKKKFSSWIYRIAHNEAINAIKKSKKEIPLPDDIDFKSEEDIEEDFNEKEIVASVEKCFDKMPTMYSEPLYLYTIEEKSYKEISDILRIPMGTVATRINRAKILMKKICQKI